jgi:hypothetical protein
VKPTTRLAARVAKVSAVCATLIGTSIGPAMATPVHTVDDFAFDADGICPFTVHLTIHNDTSTTTTSTSTGSVQIAHVTETDTIAANGTTIQGLPYHYTVRYVFNTDGDLVSAIAAGEIWKFQMQNGSIYTEAGRNNFLTEDIVGSFRDRNLGPVCAALAS